MLDKRRSDIGSERVFMNSVVKKCFVVLLFANFIGLVGCEISDYSELRRARDERAVETNGDEPAVASLAPETSGVVSGPPVTAPKPQTKVPVAPDPVVISGFSLAEEEAIREKLENRDAFFSTDDDGFAVEVDLAESSLGNDGLEQ